MTLFSLYTFAIQATWWTFICQPFPFYQVIFDTTVTTTKRNNLVLLKCSGDFLFRILHQWGLVWGVSTKNEVIVHPTQGMALECQSEARLRLQALWPHPPTTTMEQSKQVPAGFFSSTSHEWPHSCIWAQPPLGENTTLRTCQQGLAEASSCRDLWDL